MKRVMVSCERAFAAEEERRRAAPIAVRIKTSEEPMPEPMAARVADSPTVAALLWSADDRKVALLPTWPT